MSVPSEVRIDGRVVTRSRSDADLLATASGWKVTRTPFPGIVLKLAPRAGTLRVELTLP